MPSTSPQGPSSLPQTVIVRASGEFVVTLSTAQQIQRALETYLVSSREETEKALPGPLFQGLPKDAGEAFINSAGQVRIGLWLLEARGDELVLTYRELPPHSGVNIQYIAHLLQAEGTREWKVASITYARIYPRR
jgi:hypothetical protein